jgi:hypothetical protein
MATAFVAAPQSMRFLRLTPGGAGVKPTLAKAVFVTQK